MYNSDVQCRSIRRAHGATSEHLKRFMVGIDYLVTARPSPATDRVVQQAKNALDELVGSLRALLHEAETMANYEHA